MNKEIDLDEDGVRRFLLAAEVSKLMQSHQKVSNAYKDCGGCKYQQECPYDFIHTGKCWRWEGL